MTLSDNSNALLLRRKMARRTQSQSTSNSPTISSPSQNSNVNHSKGKMIKSHSDSKRIYRSNDILLQEPRTSDSRKKTPEETEFDEKIRQLNKLKRNSFSIDEYDDINYSLGDEINQTEKKNQNLKKEIKEPLSIARGNDFREEKIHKEPSYIKNATQKNPHKNETFYPEATKKLQTKPSANKLTNWNEDEESKIPNDEELDEKNDSKTSHSILKSLNMYRF